MLSTFKLALTLAAVLAASAAQATTLAGPLGSGAVTAVNATAATATPFPLAFFGSAASNGIVSTTSIALGDALITVSPNASSPIAGLYAGNVADVARSPFTGVDLPGAATNEYLVAQRNDPVTLRYDAPRSVFNLLWGSVDTFNSLDLQLFERSTLISDLRVTGSDILALIGGGNSSAFVTITGDQAFNTVVLNSTSNAFEFVPGVAVPEPFSITLLATSLFGLTLLIRTRSKAPQTITSLIIR